MFTKNFRNMICGKVSNHNVDCILESGVTKKEVNLYIIENVFRNDYSTIKSDEKEKVYYKFFELGNGNTPETVNDYKLANKITNLSFNSYTVTSNLNKSNDIYGDEEVRHIFTVTNNSSSEVSVCEMGLFICVESYQSPVLLYRKTFEPVKIAVGETKTFTIIIN